MTEIMGEKKEVGVFELPSKFNKHISNVYSFALSHEKSYKFSDWLNKFDSEAFNAQVAMK